MKKDQRRMRTSTKTKWTLKTKNKKKKLTRSMTNNKSKSRMYCNNSKMTMKNRKILKAMTQIEKMRKKI